MEKPAPFQTKLKNSDPDVKQYIRELEKHNARLQGQVVKLKAKQVDLNHRIAAFEKEFKKRHGPFQVRIVSYADVKKEEELGEMLRAGRQRVSPAKPST